MKTILLQICLELFVGTCSSATEHHIRIHTLHILAYYVESYVTLHCTLDLTHEACINVNSKHIYTGINNNLSQSKQNAYRLFDKQK